MALQDINPRDVSLPAQDRQLSSGETLSEDIVSGRLYGRDDHPKIVVLGGISASRFVADRPDGGAGWWSPLVRAGGPIDTRHFQIIGYDFAPHICQEHTPNSITTEDQADRLVALLDYIGINHVAAIIGSSYGGMTALAFAQKYPDRVGQLCIIGAAHRPYPIGVGWRGIQRRIVRLAIDAGRPKEGLSLARELAMTTYRTPEEFADRFALDITDHTHGARFDICDYLSSRGQVFADIMDAKRFLLLSESIDLHRVEPEAITTPSLLISAISDQLAPLADMRELRDRLAGSAELFTMTSLFGHDAFLKEFDTMAPRLTRFCESLIHE